MPPGRNLELGKKNFRTVMEVDLPPETKFPLSQFRVCHSGGLTQRRASALRLYSSE